MTNLPVNLKTESLHTHLKPYPAQKQGTESTSGREAAPFDDKKVSGTSKPADQQGTEQVTAKVKPEDFTQKIHESKESEASTDADVKQAVTRLNQYVQSIERELNFSIEKETGKTIVKVIDSHTNEVIRQLPSETAIAIAKQVKENRNLGFKGTA